MLIEGSADLRFIDKKTGAEIYAMPLGAPMTGGTITYTVNGRQFLVGRGERHGRQWRGTGRAGDPAPGSVAEAGVVAAVAAAERVGVVERLRRRRTITSASQPYRPPPISRMVPVT